MRYVSMTCTDDNGNFSVNMTYPEDATWMSLVDQFNQFLCSIGYIPLRYNEFVECLELQEDFPVAKKAGEVTYVD